MMIVEHMFNKHNHLSGDHVDEIGVLTKFTTSSSLGVPPQ
jgi:hypothetical protein